MKYRALLQTAQILENIDTEFAILNTLMPRKQINYTRLYVTLINNLTPIIPVNVPTKFFEGKIETFLTCLKLSSYLRKTIFDDKTGKFFEEVSLNAIHKTLMTSITAADLYLLLSELPKILQLDHSIIKNICNDCIQYISQILLIMRSNVPGHSSKLWDRYFQLEEQLNFLKIFDN